MNPPENDRRKKEKPFLVHVVEIFNGKQGRKVAFGIWGFWVATSLCIADKITGIYWFYSFLTCAALIGFGTTVDSVVEKFGDKIASVAASKVNTVVETETKTTVTTDATPPAS